MGWFFNPFTGKFDYFRTDAEIQAAAVEDDAYGAGWNGDISHAPSQNAVYDELVSHYAKASVHHARYTNAEAKAAAIAGWIASRALQISAGGTLQVSAVTLAELNYLDGVTSAIQAQIDAKVAKALFDAHTILIAITDDTPAALSVPASRIVGRASTGNIVALTGAQLWAILSGQAAANVSMNAKKLTSVADPTSNQDAATKVYADLHVLKTLFDAQSILAAVTDNNPVMLAVAEDRLLGRRTGQNIEAISPANIWAFLSGHPSASVDFNKQQLQAMCCHNGTSFPASPNTAQWFYRTDIDTLFTYEGGWKPIISFAAVDYYVDGTNGSDAVGKGYGSGADAAQTFAWLFSMIPPLNGGNVTVHMSVDTFGEDLSIYGKYFTGPYTLTVEGTWSDDVSETTATGGTAGTANTATQATVVKTGAGWTVNAYRGKWVRFSDDTPTAALQGDIRVIWSNTSDTLTLVGGLDAAPANGEKFQISHPGTVTDSILIFYGQVGVLVSTIDTAKKAVVSGLSQATLRYIKADTLSTTFLIGISHTSDVAVDRCYVKPADAQGKHGIGCFRGSLVLLSGNYVRSTNQANTRGIDIYDMSVGRMTGIANIIGDAAANTGFAIGVALRVGSSCNMQIGGVPNHVITGCAVGVKVEKLAVGEKPSSASDVSYSNNTSDYSETTATSGHIV